MSAAARLPSLAQPVAEASLSGVFLKDLDHSSGDRISRKYRKRKPRFENVLHKWLFFNFYCFFFFFKKLKVIGKIKQKIWVSLSLSFSLFLCLSLSLLYYPSSLNLSTWNNPDSPQPWNVREGAFPSYDSASSSPRDSGQPLATYWAVLWVPQSSLDHMGPKAEVYLRTKELLKISQPLSFPLCSLK